MWPGISPSNAKPPRQSPPGRKHPRAKRPRQQRRITVVHGAGMGPGWHSGLFLSFLLYIGHPARGAHNRASDRRQQDCNSRARQSLASTSTPCCQSSKMEVDVDPAEVAQTRTSANTEAYLLQAGSFRQREDADRRRAELLLLGLEPTVEETNGDNGQLVPGLRRAACQSALPWPRPAA